MPTISTHVTSWSVLMRHVLWVAGMGRQGVLIRSLKMPAAANRIGIMLWLELVKGVNQVLCMRNKVFGDNKDTYVPKHVASPWFVWCACCADTYVLFVDAAKELYCIDPLFIGVIKSAKHNYAKTFLVTSVELHNRDKFRADDNFISRRWSSTCWGVVFGSGVFYLHQSSPGGGGGVYGSGVFNLLYRNHL